MPKEYGPDHLLIGAILLVGMSSAKRVGSSGLGGFGFTGRSGGRFSASERSRPSC